MILQAEYPDFLNIESYKISTENLSPVTFYNFYNHKYSDIDRVKYLKAKSPERYPKGTLVTSQMELE